MTRLAMVTIRCVTCGAELLGAGELQTGVLYGLTIPPCTVRGCEGDR